MTGAEPLAYPSGVSDSDKPGTTSASSEKRSSAPSYAAAGVELSDEDLDRALEYAQKALDLSLTYALERKTFGTFIANHQAIQFLLADMRRDIEAGRVLLCQSVPKSAAELAVDCDQTSFSAAGDETAGPRPLPKVRALFVLAALIGGVFLVHHLHTENHVRAAGGVQTTETPSEGDTTP